MALTAREFSITPRRMSSKPSGSNRAGRDQVRGSIDHDSGQPGQRWSGDAVARRRIVPDAIHYDLIMTGTQCPAEWWALRLIFGVY